MDRVDERGRVLELLKRFGSNATSFQMLEPGFSYWFDAGDDGDQACVGYVDTGGAWVAAAPLAARERLGVVAEQFAAAAAAHGRRACCFATDEDFRASSGWNAMRIGDQPTWTPGDWEPVLRASRSLREQLRRARAKGVEVRALEPAELEPGHPVRAQLDGLIARWQASKPIAPMGFLVQVDPFTFPAERRYFVATRADAATEPAVAEPSIVGFLGIIPIYARRGWFFEDFIRDPAAPNGTVELLVDAGMRAAADEGVEEVTLGLVPLAGEVGPWLSRARRWGRALYDFDGLRAFKAKLKPHGWEPIYLAYPPRRSPMVAMADALTAFARGGLLRFGVETVLRGPAVILRTLGVLLVGWTIVLALPTSARWFPSELWQYGWVGFDAAVAVAMFTLGARWRHGLATLLACAVTADATLTLGQALVYNVPHRQAWFDLPVIGVAVFAPTMVAVMLWNARAHRRPS